MSVFVYKNPISDDRCFYFIRRYAVTDAAVHDSQCLDTPLDAESIGVQVFADSAYRSEDVEQVLMRERGYRSRIHKKAQEAANYRCARVEHVFAAQTHEQGGKFLCTIGMAQARVKMGMMNLVYKLRRYTWVVHMRRMGVGITTPINREISRQRHWYPTWRSDSGRFPSLGARNGWAFFFPGSEKAVFRNILIVDILWEVVYDRRISNGFSGYRGNDRQVRTNNRTYCGWLRAADIPR